MGWGCAGEAPEPGPPRIALLISIDTLRPDHLGAYGHDRPTSPGLDALAAEGVLFETALSTSPWTLPAHATLLTGLYPHRHGLTSATGSLAERIPTLATILGAQAFETAAIVNSAYLDRRYGFARGFDRYHYIREQPGRLPPSIEVTDRAIAWLEEERTRRLFLFLHYYDVHSDYRSLPRYEREFLRPYAGAVDGSTEQLLLFRSGRFEIGDEDVARLRDLYDAGIRQMDDEIGRLIAYLAREDLLDETLLVVTSDHGEEFLEHGGVLHGRTQYEELLRVPLLLRGPGIPAGTRVAAPVSLVDVVPTVLAALGLPVPPETDGVDLAAFWSAENGGPEARYLFGEADHNNAEHDITRSVRRDRFKLHYNRMTKQATLYDLERDSDEQHDAAAEEPERTRRMLQQLVRIPDAPNRTELDRELSLDEIRHLESLGYLR